MAASDAIGVLPFYHRPALGVAKNRSDVVAFFPRYVRRDFRMVRVNGRQTSATVLGSSSLARSDKGRIVTPFAYPTISSCVTSMVFS
jgi:hypothetical protein